MGIKNKLCATGLFTLVSGALPLTYIGVDYLSRVVSYFCNGPYRWENNLPLSKTLDNFTMGEGTVYGLTFLAGSAVTVGLTALVLKGIREVWKGPQEAQIPLGAAERLVKNAKGTGTKYDVNVGDSFKPE